MITEEQELVERASVFLRELLKASRLDLEFRCEAADGAIQVDLEGQDAVVLLSNNARALYALNHLLNQALARRRHPDYSFVVDCEQYRSTRVLELQLLARKAAEKVAATGSRMALQPMPASERRVIHLALKEQPGVRTESEGTGLHRRVVILPGG